jgi:histidine triad (HIT) family protein
VGSFACAQQTCRRRGSSLPDDCLFCDLYREGDHVLTRPGVVAIRDINPKADVHLLVIPERHVETFRDVADFSPDEAKQMLEFIAEAAKHEGLEDYNVIVNVGRGAGQTIFHLHWHVLGGRVRGMPI